MQDNRLSTTVAAELVSALKGHRFLADYCFAVYSPEELTEASLPSGGQLCGAMGESALCHKICAAAPLKQAMQDAAECGRPVVFRCPVGLLSFATSLRVGSSCLIGSGTREPSLDVGLLKTLADTNDIKQDRILKELEKLPIATEEEVEEVAFKVHRLLPSLRCVEPHSAFMEKTMEALSVVTAVSVDIDHAATAAEAVDLLSETLGILLNLPGIAVAIDAGDASRFPLRGTWGMPEQMGAVATARVREVFPAGPAGSVFLTDDACEELFPEVECTHATCIPLASGKETFGVVALFNTELNDRDALVAQLLTGRVAAKLVALKKEEEHRREASLSTRLLKMITALALTEGREEAFGSVLEMSADLADASCGSLMLLDGERQAMHIECAMGMNLQLARNLSVKLGEGIAGKVAISGHPFLVNDIEKDSRIGGQNRPRFKTKSFISIPLKFREEILGVLNLSDKKDQGIFTDADLSILTAFVSHAAQLMHRNMFAEKVEFLERLSVTDPLTELYNRRFLKKRMEEELNRSQRQGVHFTVMFIDLDNFKIYNDVCGHVAGDKALKKVARILRSCAREMDVVTRYGGEEFCLVLPGTSKKESLFLAERIRHGIEIELFTGEQNLPQGRLTASIGLSSFPEDGTSMSSLIKAADVALYQAKGDGRNRISHFVDFQRADERRDSTFSA